MVFAGPEPGRTVLVAHRLDQVVPVLEAVETVTGAGRWAAGFVSYEAAPALDPNLSVRQAAPDEPSGEVPFVWFGIFDRPETVESLGPGAHPLDDYSVTQWRPGWDAGQYRADVDAVRVRIADGDTYQCNLTVRLQATVDGEPFGLYRDLALAQRGSHNAHLDTGRFTPAGS